MSTAAALRQRFSPADWFHWYVDDAIRRDGGPGNLGQLRLRLRRPLTDPARLAEAWRSLGERLWPLGGVSVFGLRGPHFVLRGPARLELETGDGVDALAELRLRAGLDADRGELAHLAYAGGDEPGAVLTWSHRLCDARGAMGLLAALERPELAEGERWWHAGYREACELPAPAAARGRLARAAVELLRPLRASPPLRLADGAGRRRNPAAPIVTASCTLGEATAQADERQRRCTGRLAETPFLLACTAAAIEAAAGIGRDLLFPLAVDQRRGTDSRLVANCHGFIFLRLPAGVASRSLIEAGKLLHDQHRAWIAGDGATKMAAALSWFPWVGRRFARAQLGFDRAGLAATCLVANTGRTTLPPRWFGAEVAGIDHVVAVPGQPGLAVLFHRDARGLGFDVVASGAVARLAPPAQLGEALRWQLLERPLDAVT